jgi:hypothetical protein
MICQLIASPYPEGHLVVSPGREGGIRIGASRYAELRDAPPPSRPGSRRQRAPPGAWTWTATPPGKRSWSAQRPPTGTPAPPTS